MVYPIPDVAFSEFAPYRPRTVVQLISTLASSTKEMSHSRGSISHLRGLLVHPRQVHHDLLVPL